MTRGHVNPLAYEPEGHVSPSRMEVVVRPESAGRAEAWSTPPCSPLGVDARGEAAPVGQAAHEGQEEDLSNVVKSMLARGEGGKAPDPIDQQDEVKEEREEELEGEDLTATVARMLAEGRRRAL